MKALSLAGSNETGTILLLLIVATWFFTSARFTALKKVITSPFKEVEAPKEDTSGGSGGETVISGGDGADGEGTPNSNVG